MEYLGRSWSVEKNIRRAGFVGHGGRPLIFDTKELLAIHGVSPFAGLTADEWEVTQC